MRIISAIKGRTLSLVLAIPVRLVRCAGMFALLLRIKAENVSYKKLHSEGDIDGHLKQVAYPSWDEWVKSGAPVVGENYPVVTANFKRKKKRGNQSRCGLPLFIIGGVQKGGTTFLRGLLAQHPLLTAQGETHFWDKQDADILNLSQARILDEYCARLAPIENQTATFDTTPAYIRSPLVPKLLASTILSVKVVFLLRDPVVRDESRVRMGLDNLAAEKGCTVAFEAAHNHSFSAVRHVPWYVGEYFEQLVHWYTHIPRESILVLDSDELFVHPRAVGNKIFKFVGLPLVQPQVLKPKAVKQLPSGAARHNSKCPHIDFQYNRTVAVALCEYFQAKNVELGTLVRKTFQWNMKPCLEQFQNRTDG